MSDKTITRKSPLSAFLIILVMLAALIPFIYSLLLSFTDFHPTSGLFSSSYFGLDNYRSVVRHTLFSQLLKNSLLLSLLSLFAAVLAGLPLAVFLSFIKNKQTTVSVAGLLLIPYFIPASVYYTIIVRIFSPDFFSTTATWPLAFATLNLLPGAALIAFSGTVFSLFYRMKSKSALQGALSGCALAACLFLFLSFSPPYEASLLVSEPAVQMASETFDTVVFQTSLYQSTFSQASSFYAVKASLQLLIGLIPLTLLMIQLKKLDRTLQPLPVFRRKKAKQPVSGIQLAAWCAGVLFLLALLSAAGLPSFNLINNLTRYLPANIIILVAALCLSFVVALVFLSGVAETGRGLLMLAIYLMLSASQALHAQYLLARQFYLANTVLSTPLSQWLQPSSLLLLMLLALIVYNLGIRAGNKGLLPGLAGVFALFTASQAVGAFVPHLIHTNIPAQYTYGLLLRQGTAVLSGQVINYQPEDYALLYSLVVVICAILGLLSAWLMKVCLSRATETRH